MQKTILYAVLNWGLGHATRSIPIIQYLVGQGHRLIVVSDGLALTLLKKEFPKLTLLPTQSYDVNYAKSGKQFNIELALQIPKFIKAIKSEQADCNELCAKYAVDLIISDNRYGFYHSTIPSAFICHQLFLRYPANKLIEKLVNKSYQGYLKKFDKLWVPDFAPPNNISGEMSVLPWKNISYLGIDSRLSYDPTDEIYTTLTILSGPEPQRSLMETEVLKKIKLLEGKHCIVRGSSDKAPKQGPKLTLINLASTEELNELINCSRLVICRAGYTSIMDLIKLRKSAILIPTPGQAEQEYLAQVLTEKKWFQACEQGDLQMEVNETYQVPKLKTPYDFQAIQEFLSC